ncbi:TonB-linked outer membrane protein, SusC/RagA family [Pedobacter africanus]|uniref:TonB-linked outer membrane protein, SusC/RagA family n=2 Tax=Pedobacter africanus TaxID=151894 RepID=A0A1W2DA04_9SPHI|nr:TonB-linked outer membrane protein, SusC/RagA family [Pedobacter africanus]
MNFFTFFSAVFMLQRKSTQLILVMKLTTVLLIASLLQVSASVYSQKITLKKKDASIDLILKSIERQSEYVFLYDKLEVIKSGKVSIDVKDARIEDIMEICLKDQPLTYKIFNKTVILKRKEEHTQTLFPGNMFEIIKGKVMDESGRPVPGASIKVKGSSASAITDASGFFTINAKSDDILVISYVGSKTQEILVGENKQLHIVLKDDVKSLDDFVVVGYGKQKRINLSGAVDAISSKEIENRPIPSIGAGLQGLIPNLNIANGSGRASDSTSLNIRGVTSLGGQSGDKTKDKLYSSPYILVDNVPYTAGELSLLNPNDIESVTVLKDAASAAIYGARASFGVILITTKTPKSGKLSVSANAFYAYKTLGKLPQTITDPYLSYTTKHEAAFPYYPQLFNDEAIRNYAKQRSENPSLPTTYVNPSNANQWIYVASTDWFKEAFNTISPSYNANFNLSKKSEDVGYLLSAEYMKNDGVIKNANETYDRYNLRGKIDVKLLKWLNFGNNTAFTTSLYNAPTSSMDNFSYFWEINRQNSLDAVYNPDGTFTAAGANTIGRVQKGGRTLQKYNNFLTTFNATADVIKDVLEIKGDITFRRNTGILNGGDFRVPYNSGPNTATQYQGPGTSYIRADNSETRNNITNLYADYHQTFNKHYVQALAGYNQEYRYDQVSWVSKAGLISSSLPSLNLATGAVTTGETIKDWAVRGWFYRLNYIYADKYIVEFNGRYDGTSKFPRRDRWGFFPSASAAWVVSNENFMKSVKDGIRLDLLKFRGSYGSLGNQDVDAYYYIANMKSSQIGQILNGGRPQAVYPPDPVSPSLTWEKVSTANFGVDMSWFNNKLDINFDKYTRYTDGMLTKGKTLPGVFGVDEPRLNAADLKTKGWELRVGWKDAINIAKSPFSYGIGINVADSRSFITRFDNPNKNLTDYYVGQEIGEIWGLETEGFFQSEAELTSHANQQFFVSDDAGGTFGVGDLKWKDQNGDGFINRGKYTADDHGDLIRIGNSSPRYTFGVDLNLAWKGFDVRSFFMGIGKQDFYPRNNNVYFWSVFAQPWTNPTVQTMDKWSPENPNAYFPRLKSYIAEDVSELGYPQTRYLQNFAYMRLKNLTIGYTLPQAILRKLQVNRLRVYFSGENIFDKSGVKFNLDPEALSGNVYPFQKTFSFGLNVTL